jgi:hypothetical protein
MKLTLSEDDVLAVEPRSDDGGDEELGSVGVGSSVGHREKSGLGVLELEAVKHASESSTTIPKIENGKKMKTYFSSGNFSP